MIQICVFIGIRSFLHRAKEIFAREILVKKSSTRIQKLFSVIQGATIINFAVFIAFLILGNFFISSLFSDILNINLIAFVTLGGCFLFYYFARSFLDLSYSKIGQEFSNQSIFIISNLIPPKYYKGFIILLRNMRDRKCCREGHSVFDQPFRFAK